MRPVAAPPPVNPGGRFALRPKLATAVPKPAGAMTVPPPVTTAAASGLISAAEGCPELGIRPLATPPSNAAPRHTTTTAATDRSARAYDKRRVGVYGMRPSASFLFRRRLPAPADVRGATIERNPVWAGSRPHLWTRPRPYGRGRIIGVRSTVNIYFPARL